MHKLKVMLVDDEVTVLEGYKKLFDWQNHGFAIVCEANDGMSAVSLASRYRPDVILMDINIPLLSGLDAIQAIAKELPDIAVIIISGYDEFAYAQKAIQLRVAEYMLKPVKFDVLSSVLERLRRELIQNHRFASGREEINDGKRIYKIISYIHEHIAEPISLKQLSKEFFLNPTYISQLFKSETGVNYHDYVMRLRVDSAKKMLSTSDMSIAQVADRTGFQNYRNLSQVFKRLENINPSEYKETLNFHTFS